MFYWHYVSCYTGGVPVASGTKAFSEHPNESTFRTKLLFGVDMALGVIYT